MRSKRSAVSDQSSAADSRQPTADGPYLNKPASGRGFRYLASDEPRVASRETYAPPAGDSRRVSCTELVITVPGAPLGKPRMTQRNTWKKRPCVLRYRCWADAARLSAGKLPPAEAIERLDWVAYFEPPQSWSAKRRAAALGTLHRTTPDRDNVDKAVLNALFKSDSGIASGTIEKRWGTPARVVIRITLTAPQGVQAA